MKHKIKKTLLSHSMSTLMRSLILGLSLSVLTTQALANDEEVVAEKTVVEAVESQPATPATDVQSAEAVESANSSSTVAEEATADTVKPSAVTSATPPMSDIKFTGVNSLRGEVGIGSTNDAADIKLLPSDRPPIARNYFQQPPLIPHRIREYKITVRNNKCLSCHSWKNYKKARATKVSQTHFADRDGNAQSTLAARRYFCTQCHVPQVDAKPLVENNFKPVGELNK